MRMALIFSSVCGAPAISCNFWVSAVSEISLLDYDQREAPPCSRKTAEPPIIRDRCGVASLVSCMFAIVLNPSVIKLL